jgi:bzd-type benzoyl-CoA reductase N subunit
MVDLREKLEEIKEMDRHLPLTDEIEEWKKQGRKIIGWVCNYVPEELVHAADMLPIRIVGPSKEVPFDDATAYLYITTCSYVRTCFQMAYEDLYDYLDGFVLASNCDQARRLYDVWDRYLSTPYKYHMSVPHVKTDQALGFIEREIRDFKSSLEKAFGIVITSEKIRNSIQLYNRKRELLRQINEYRKLDSPPITGGSMLALLNVGNKLSVETFNGILEQLLEALGNQGEVAGPPRPRLMISGSCLNNVNYINFIEEQGGVVVADDLCTGIRYWRDKVSADEGRDPMNAIAERYLRRFPCARMYPGEDRFEQVVALAKEYRVDGVIQEMIRYCTPTAWERPWLRRSLEEAGFKVLSLEVLYGAEGTGQLKVRIQAFLEMLTDLTDYF